MMRVLCIVVVGCMSCFAAPGGKGSSPASDDWSLVDCGVRASGSGDVASGSADGIVLDRGSKE